VVAAAQVKFAAEAFDGKAHMVRTKATASTNRVKGDKSGRCYRESRPSQS